LPYQADLLFSSKKSNKNARNLKEVLFRCAAQTVISVEFHAYSRYAGRDSINSNYYFW